MYILSCAVVQFQFSSSNYTWNEGDGEVAVEIQKVGVAEVTVSASLQVSPGTAQGEVKMQVNYFNILFVIMSLSLSLPQKHWTIVRCSLILK